MHASTAGIFFLNPNDKMIRDIVRPADEEASRNLIILINSSVQEVLLAARGPCAPTSCITAMADLEEISKTNKRPTLKM